MSAVRFGKYREMRYRDISTCRAAILDCLGNKINFKTPYIDYRIDFKAMLKDLMDTVSQV